MYFRLSYITEHQLKRPVHDRTVNSKAAGRLLAAGGLYNGNIEGFRHTAEQLGGDAAKGYDQVLNQTTSGLLISAASLLVVRNPMAAEELTSYLGKYKHAHVLLDDMNLPKLTSLLPCSASRGSNRSVPVLKAVLICGSEVGNS